MAAARGRGGPVDRLAGGWFGSWNRSAGGVFGNEPRLKRRLRHARASPLQPAPRRAAGMLAALRKTPVASVIPAPRAPGVVAGQERLQPRWHRRVGSRTPRPNVLEQSREAFARYRKRAARAAMVMRRGFVLAVQLRQRIARSIAPRLQPRITAHHRAVTLQSWTDVRGGTCRFVCGRQQGARCRLDSGQIPSGRRRDLLAILARSPFPIHRCGTIR